MSETGAYEKNNDKEKNETQNSDSSDIEVLSYCYYKLKIICFFYSCSVK